MPLLVELCVQLAIDNIRYLGNVGNTDFHLLARILPHCTLQQLKHIEDCTEGRDLSPVSDELWKNFFERRFGTENMNLATERMRNEKVRFSWRQLYEAKIKAIEDREERISSRIRERYRMEEEKKQSRQIRLCNKVPPSGRKRNFYGEPIGGLISKTKNSIMKKAKLEFVNSIEVKNLASMNMMKSKEMVRWTQAQVSSHAKKSSGFSDVSSSLTSRNRMLVGKRSCKPL